MYSYREYGGGAGEFHSFISGKTYAFKGTRDSSDKRRAKAEMEADHRQVREQLTARLGRAPTDREMREGVAPADSRTLRQQIADDGVIVSNPPRDPSVNPHADRLAHLQSQTPRTRADRASQKRRIEMTKQASNEWEARKAAEREAAEEQERIASDVADAKATVALCRFGTGYTAEECRIAERLLAGLEATHNVEAYREARDHFDLQVKERREAAAEKLEEAAVNARELANQVRRGEAEAQAEAQAEA